MNNITKSLALCFALTLVISACSLPGSSEPTNELIADPNTIPSIELAVQADTAAPIDKVGQTVALTYSIKNSGSISVPGVVTVTGATVNCPQVESIGNNDKFLDTGETLVCIASYITTQADLDKGAITIVSTADVNGTISNQVITTVPTVPNRILKLSKTANPSTYNSLSQTITYSYIIMNTGTLEIGPAQFTVTDAGIPTIINCGNADVTLAPNATVGCTANYTITQADMGAASVATEATASGGGVGPSDPATATITNSSTGGATPSSNLTPGSNIQHTVQTDEWLWQIARCYSADYKAVRAANPQLADPDQISPDMIVNVPNIGSEGQIYGPPCVKAHTVQAGETWASIAQQYNADPIVLQTVNKNNIATGLVLKVPLNSAKGSVQTTKAITLTATASTLTYSELGQTITFTYVIKNSGDVTLGPAQFNISGNLFGSGLFPCGAADTTLTPNATVTCNSTYMISEADMNANSITNTVSASGGGAGTSPSASSTINKSSTSLTLVTTASPLSFNQVNQVITYTFVIKNSSNATLGPDQFTISNSFISTAPINCDLANKTLAPNELITCSATYTITEADMLAGVVTNNATASGGGAVSATDTNTINKE